MTKKFKFSIEINETELSEIKARYNPIYIYIYMEYQEYKYFFNYAENFISKYNCININNSKF